MMQENGTNKALPLPKGQDVNNMVRGIIKLNCRVLISRRKDYPTLTDEVDSVHIAHTGDPERKYVYMLGESTYLSGKSTGYGSLRHVKRTEAKEVIHKSKKLESGG